MSDTIFSKIIRGEIPCHKVYEDAHVLAFLDVNPLSPGHTLVIPKEPAVTVDALSDDAGAAIGRVEDSGAGDERASLRVALQHGVDQDRKPGAVSGPHLQCYPADLALHRQQRGEVSLVVEPAAHGEQVGEGTAPD